MRLQAFRDLALLLALPALALLGSDSAAAQEPRTEDWFEVKISQGPNGPGPFEGTHQASGDVHCSSTAGSIWGADLTIDQPTGLTEVLVMLTGVPASGGRTAEVELGLSFGQLDDMDGGMLGIGMVAGGGSGVATVERKGGGAVIRIEGTAHYGAGISAVIECRTVEVVG